MPRRVNSNVDSNLVENAYQLSKIDKDFRAKVFGGSTKDRARGRGQVASGRDPRVPTPEQLAQVRRKIIGATMRAGGQLVIFGSAFADAAFAIENAMRRKR